MKSRDFARRYLFNARWRHRLDQWTDYVNKHYIAVKNTI